MPKAVAELVDGLTVVFSKRPRDRNKLLLCEPGKPHRMFDCGDGTTLVFNRGQVSICTAGEVSYEQAAFGDGIANVGAGNDTECSGDAVPALKG